MEMLCKHGTPKEWCAICSAPPKPEPRKPVNKKPEIKTVHGVGAITKPELVTPYGRALVKTQDVRNHDEVCSHLDSTTLFVHIQGHPFLWVIKKILERAPNLQTIQVYPTVFPRLNPDTHIKICQERGVRIVTGHWRPEMAWAGENRSSFYETQRNFFRTLEGDQKNLFNEMVLLGFDEALMTSRYFCLEKEEFIPQREIAVLFGYSSDPTEASERINAVICYLDPTFQAGISATRRATQFQKRVEKIRSFLANERWKEEFMQELGISELPKGLLPVFFETYREVIRAWKEGKLEALKTRHERWYQVIVLRYGLLDNQFRILGEVGSIISVTRSRVGQLEERAFKFLGIKKQNDAQEL